MPRDGSNSRCAHAVAERGGTACFLPGRVRVCQSASRLNVQFVSPSPDTEISLLDCPAPITLNKPYRACPLEEVFACLRSGVPSQARLRRAAAVPPARRGNPAELTLQRAFGIAATDGSTQKGDPAGPPFQHDCNLAVKPRYMSLVSSSFSMIQLFARMTGRRNTRPRANEGTR